MNLSLLFGGLAAARKSVDEVVQRTVRSLVAYTVLVCSGFAALGFFTAGGLLYLTSMWGGITAFMIVAAAYAVLGSIFFLAITMPWTTRPSSQVRPLSVPKSRIENSVAANPDLPGSVIAVGLLAVAGYLVGRSMTRRR